MRKVWGAGRLFASRERKKHVMSSKNVELFDDWVEQGV